jgi:FdhD protein
MEEPSTLKIVRVTQQKQESVQRQVVEEYPLKLRVNGRELATLICSPHQLNFLVVGFLRLQGFIESLDDISSLGVCKEYGQAEVLIRTSLPERLQPTLTSGCGAGIAFNLPEKLLNLTWQDRPSYHCESLYRLMKEMQGLAENYQRHGGIHSAAVGDDRGLLLSAEDLGRHNTLDRIAGEALFKEIPLQGKMLVTSGRVSTEMVAKAARLGLGLIASRTSPTDKAVDLCEQAGITLVGYLRGSSMEIYSHPQHLKLQDY